MEKLKVTLYMASAIEHNPTMKKEKVVEDWKQVAKDAFKENHSVGIYDPVEREAQKTGKPAGGQVSYIQGLKQGGHWNQFGEAMSSIWWGKINAEAGDKLEIMRTLRNRFLIDGNELRDLDFWGDTEAVLRSNFIMAYLEKNVKTVGTIVEIHDCYLMNIPVFLILPDQSKTEANSTLIDMVMKSGGEIFYNTNDAVKFIKEEYKI